MEIELFRRFNQAICSWCSSGLHRVGHIDIDTVRKLSEDREHFVDLRVQRTLRNSRPELPHPKRRVLGVG